MIDSKTYLTLRQSLELLWRQGGIFMIDSILSNAHVEEYCNNEGIQYIPVSINSWSKSLLQILNDSGAFQNIDFGIFLAKHQQEEDALVNIFAMLGKKRRILLHFEANDYFPMHQGGMRALYNALIPLRGSIAAICIHDSYNNSMVKRINLTFMNKIVYVSYKHNEATDSRIQAIINGLVTNHINYSIDKEHVGYRDSIRKYEEEIGQGARIIVVITDDYLESPHCMYELTQIWKNKNVKERVFPIIDIEKYPRDSEGLLKSKAYWTNERSKKCALLAKETGSIELLQRELADINDIIDNINNVWTYIHDINSLDMMTLTKDNAQYLMDQIKESFATEKAGTNLQTNNLTDINGTSPYVAQNGNTNLNIGNNYGIINLR